MRAPSTLELSAWTRACLRVVWAEERPQYLLLQCLHPETGCIGQAEVKFECEQDLHRLLVAVEELTEMVRRGPPAQGAQAS